MSTALMVARQLDGQFLVLLNWTLGGTGDDAKLCGWIVRFRTGQNDEWTNFPAPSLGIENAGPDDSPRRQSGEVGVVHGWASG